MFVREQGDHWAPPIRELHKELVERGYLLATPGRTRRRPVEGGAGPKEEAGLAVRLAVLGVGPASSGAPRGPQFPAQGRRAPTGHKQLEFLTSGDAPEALPPMPPFRRQRMCPGITGWPEES